MGISNRLKYLVLLFAIFTLISPQIVLANEEDTVLESLEKKYQSFNIEENDTAPSVNSNEITYSMYDLNNMSYEELILTLEQIEWEQITDLFIFNGDSNAFYSDKNRMEFLLDELESRGKTFTAQDSKGIHTIVEVVRSGFYLGFYNESLSYLNERAYQEKAIPALKAIGENESFGLGLTEQDKVVQAFGSLIGNTASDEHIVSLAVPILNQVIHDTSLLNDFNKANAAYFIIQSIDYDLQSFLYNTGEEAYQTVWYGKINDYIEALGEAALIEEVGEDNEWFLNNAIYYLGQINEFHTDETYVQQKLTEAMEIHGEMSEPYLTAAEQLDTKYNGRDSNGNTIDYEQLLEDAKEYYLPNEYTFEDNKFVIKAGDQVTEEKIQQLYWASKEVESQYFRFIGKDEPLEIDNPDDVLTMVIYNSPKEYQMNRLLYGFDTNNGGIYIEGIGTFFTYERTKQDSIYSLEELFRHEFVHYLQGRYTVPGMWGEGEIYENERLTWFEEGGAEFFAGSTRTNGIEPRRSIINGLALNPEHRQSAHEVLNATYGSFDFYNYSYVLHSYLYNQRFEQYKSLYNAIQENDVVTYDLIRSEMMNDTALDQSYRDYMEYLIENKDDFGIPGVSEDYLLSHDSKSIHSIVEELSEHFDLQFEVSSISSSHYFDTFQLGGSFVGGQSKGQIEDYKTMENMVNEKLEDLENGYWSGYKTLTGYYLNYYVNDQGQLTFDIVLRGIYTGQENEDHDIIIRTDIPKSVEVNEVFEVTAEHSEAVSGEIASVQWDFGDGTIQDGMQATHQYSEAGNYIIKVMIEHTEGFTKTAEQEIEVGDIGGTNPDPNPDPEDETFNYLVEQAVDADAGEWIYGDLEGDKYHGVYKFELEQPGKYFMMLADYTGDSSAQWVIYNEETGLEIVAYPTEIEEGVLSGILDVDEPGTFYIHVYKTSDRSLSYGFSLTQQ